MHWPQFWCKNYVRFAFIFHLFCWEFMISYILVSSTISVSDDVRFVHHKCDGPTGTGVIYSSAGRGFTPCFMARVAHFLVFLVGFVDQCFMVSVVQFLVYLVSFCWPVFSPISCWLLHCLVFLRYVSSDYSLGIFKIFL